MPPGGDTVDGVFLPGGTAVGHNLIGLMRSAAVFGRDSDVFRPERFLEPESRVERERTAELAFGSGRWMCAGKLVAFTQLYKTVFDQLHVKPPQQLDPGRPWEEESAIFWHHADMMVRITDAERM